MKLHLDFKDTISFRSTKPINITIDFDISDNFECFL